MAARWRSLARQLENYNMDILLDGTIYAVTANVIAWAYIIKREATK